MLLATPKLFTQWCSIAGAAAAAAAAAAAVAAAAAWFPAARLDHLCGPKKGPLLPC